MIHLLKKTALGILMSVLIFNTTVFADYVYEDIEYDSPYFYAIEYLRRNDVFPETKLFRPDILISKAEFIKYLTILNSRDLKLQRDVHLPFEDTYDNAWYAPYFYEALKLGILSDREVKIDPYKKLTVAEALELLFHSRTIPIPRKHVGHIPYSDVEKNEHYQALIMRAIELGIVKPERSDYFGLYKRVNRAMAARMIYKMDLVDLRDPGSAQGLQSLDPTLQKLISSWELISSNFFDRDQVDPTKLTDKAIQAMVETLNDPYSVYMDQNENKIFTDGLDGQFEGIGAFIAISEEDEIVIVSPIKDAPAYKAGIKSGDIIKKVDDFDTTGASLHEVVNRIKGPKGTKVKLTIKRGSSMLVIEITRGLINVEALEYEVIRNNLLHIRLISFNQNAIQSFREMVEITRQNPDIKGLILDLRDNPGGLLDVATDMLNYLLPKGTPAVQIKYNYFNYTQNTVGNGELKDYPIVVLINKGSASASEILAGALKERGSAILIGETSFGKGTVQEVNYFGDNSSLKLTVAEWLTPDGNSINGNGIKPDIEIIQGLSETDDRQLARAIQELNKKIR